VTVKPATVHVGDKIALDHTIRNDGRDTVPGGTYNVDLYVDGNQVSFNHRTFDMRPGRKSDAGMLPGYHHWEAVKPGKFRYRLIVDESNNLRETDETNNVFEGDIDVLP
jgi:subtilase family serine protease